MIRRRRYTREEINYIAARFREVTTRVIAAEIGRTPGGVRLICQRYGIKRTAKQKSAIFRSWSRKPKGDCHV